MSSIFDFNDKERIEKQIMNQLNLQKARRESGQTSMNSPLIKQEATREMPVPIRPSVYFGALQIDRLNEWEQADPKLTQLFEDCFGRHCPPPRPAVKAKKKA